MAGVSYKRHIAKTFTWRLVGTIDTIILSWFISGDPFIGLKIGMSEVITKMVLYYIHERAWFRINLSKNGEKQESRKRHLAKTVTWRIIGSTDTMLIAWLISGNPIIGLKIGFAEIVTKMALYYLHERMWYKINFGITDRKKN